MTIIGSAAALSNNLGYSGSPPVKPCKCNRRTEGWRKVSFYMVDESATTAAELPIISSSAEVPSGCVSSTVRIPANRAGFTLTAYPGWTCGNRSVSGVLVLSGLEGWWQW